MLKYFTVTNSQLKIPLRYAWGSRRTNSKFPNMPTLLLVFPQLVFQHISDTLTISGGFSKPLKNIVFPFL